MGHSDRVTGVAFSPDDKTLASVSQDQTIRLWDWTNGQEIGQPLFGHTNAVLAMAFSPDGKLLASGGADNAIRVWDVDLNLDVEEMGACHIANRNLTRAEWREYFATDSTSYDSVYAKNPTCPGLPIEPAPTPTPDAASGGTITPSPLPTP
jgi:WD40 repeat protein